MPKPLAVKILDKMPKLTEALSSLAREAVLVGVPREKADRKGDSEQGMNNATLAYIHDNGSPAQNISARPFMKPGIKNVQPTISIFFKQAAFAAAHGNATGVERALTKVGLTAQASIRNRIGEGIPPPLKPGTILNRNRSRGTASKRKSEKDYAALVESGAQAAGMSQAQMQSAAGIIPLVNTGQLRNSISYVLKRY